MHAYLSPERTHDWSGNWAFGTNAFTVSNPAAFNDAQPSVISVGPSRRLSFTGPARDIITTGGSDDKEFTWLPTNADKFLEEPCLVLVLWIWEKGVYPRKPGSLYRLPLINDPARTFDDPIAITGLCTGWGLSALQHTRNSQEALTGCDVYLYSHHAKEDGHLFGSGSNAVTSPPNLACRRIDQNLMMGCVWDNSSSSPFNKA